MPVLIPWIGAEVESGIDSIHTALAERNLLTHAPELVLPPASERILIGPSMPDN